MILLCCTNVAVHKLCRTVEKFLRAEGMNSSESVTGGIKLSSTIINYKEWEI